MENLGFVRFSRGYLRVLGDKEICRKKDRWLGRRDRFIVPVEDRLFVRGVDEEDAIKYIKWIS